jgi:hypothetical protein
VHHLRPGRRTRALAQLVLVSLLAACSSDRITSSLADRAPTADASSLLTPAAAPSLDEVAAATAGGGAITNGAGLGCLTGQPNAAALTVTACVAGAASQTWTAPSSGTSGAVSAHAGSMCADAGGLNYWGLTMKCATGDATQRWTPTAAGELRSPTGYCLAAVEYASGARVQLQLCNGSTAQKWTLPAAAAPAAPPAAPAGTPLVSAAGSLCLETVGGANGNVTAVTVSPCVAGAPWQTWTVPAAGVKGVFRIFDTRCLQSLGAAGTVGTAQTIYTCVPTAPNHQWTLTAAGEIRGQNSLCMTVTAATPSPKLTLQTCTGRAEQRWSTTMPAPKALPAVTLPALAAKVTGLMGVTPSVAAVEAKGGAWTLYERNFRHYGDWHATYGGTYWENVNVYDRAMIFYVWWARTGNPAYLTRANSYAVTYRTNYVEATNYRPAAHYTMLDGIALHYLVTGDPKSLTAVGKVADGFATPAYLKLLASVTSGIDNRVQARALTSLLLAWHLKAPSAAGHNWEAVLKQAVTNVLGSQGADGAYRWTGQCGYNKPWMVGLVNDALIRYESFFPDARVVASVKKAVDYMWAKNWVAEAGAFMTLEGTCVQPWLNETTTPVSEANAMVVDGYAYVAKKTGSQSYNVVADSIFSQGMRRIWFNGAKNFNEAYTSSYRYLQYRW